VPTTAGTGSEATHFAVVYVDGQKHSVAHPLMRPTVAVVDGSLTASLPPMLTAHSGLDALCQAIESIWAIGADDAAEAAGRFDALVKAIGCSTSLAEAGITEAAQVERICTTVNVERLANNPRCLTPEDLRGLLQ